MKDGLIMLTNASLSKCEITWMAMSGVMDRNGWEQTRHKRSATRVFYNGCGSISTGFMSDVAKDRRAKKLKVCGDHVAVPQTFSWFVYENWDKYSNFTDFQEVWTMGSQIAYVSTPENNMLKEWTDRKNAGIVYCSIVDRYKNSGIRLYKENYGYTWDYPFDLPDGFLEFEAKVLLQEIPVNLQEKLVP